MTPLLILAAAPGQKSRFKSFFDPDGPGQLLKDPGGLRYAGWDMQTLDQPRIVRGEYLEVRNGDRKQLQLFRDGVFIARLRADDSLLARGATGQEPFAVGMHVKVDRVKLSPIRAHGDVGQSYRHLVLALARARQRS